MSTATDTRTEAGVPDAAQLVARVKELQPLIRRNAAKGNTVYLSPDDGELPGDG
jgi:hypothetical protein